MIETTLAETTASTIEGVKFYQTGIYIPPGLTFEKWEHLIAEMATVEKGFRFWWGDALNYGEHEYGEKYSQAMDATGLSYETIADYCHVAGKISFSLRNEKLSWTHHKVVAKLPPADQAEWLRLAEIKSLSTSELRTAIAESRQITVATGDSEPQVKYKDYESTTPSINTNGHSATVDEYEQQADELAGDESGYDWTETHNESVAPVAASRFEIYGNHAVAEEPEQDSDEYYTPEYIIDAARAVLGSISLDPATCERAQMVVQAAEYYTKYDDGLRQEWCGNVWLNPPFSKPEPFISKIIEEYESGNIDAAIVLTNNGTETRWGQAMLERFPVCFVGAKGEQRSRISFWTQSPDQPEKGNRYAQMIFFLGDNPQKFIDVFSQFGTIKQ